jgi:uncharacterized protein YdaU (DUF1376 family)
MAIQKPEWFKVDPAKFLSDAQVDVMSTLELGACFRLLCRQWLDGYVPDDPRLLARLCRLDASSMGEAWVTIEPFFPALEPGKRANRFMWIEREKVITALERKSDEGTRAARKRWNEARKNRSQAVGATPNGSPIPDAMQDQSRPEQTRAEKTSLSEQGSSDVEVSRPKKPKSEPSREATGLALLLKSEILRNKVDYKITQAQERSWAVTADRMLRLDGRKPEEAAELIRWVQRDEFWMANVLSMDTFREKFDQLALKKSQQAKSGKNGKGNHLGAPQPMDYTLTPDEAARRAGLEAARTAGARN